MILLLYENNAHHIYALLFFHSFKEYRVYPRIKVKHYTIPQVLGYIGKSREIINIGPIYDALSQVILFSPLSLEKNFVLFTLFKAHAK